MRKGIYTEQRYELWGIPRNLDGGGGEPKKRRRAYAINKLEVYKNLTNKKAERAWI